MATVYRAYDQRLGVPRAIKVMLPAYAEKPRVRARFEAEARTMAVLDHPSIVRVYDVGSNDETAWIVMELVEGGSLLQKIGSTGISVEDCLRYTARVLEALDVAHRHGVVHRDIKPHNVLLTPDGEARITDFGIARSAGQTDESFTKTGTVMGTWAFMAPEQRVNAKGVDHTADIYGLGASLFAMATGQTPMDLFAADLDPEMLVRVPDPLLPIIRKATQYQREQRYPTAKAMLDAVNALREDLDLHSQPIPTPILSPPPETAPAPSSEESTTSIAYLADDDETADGVRRLDPIASQTAEPYRPAAPTYGASGAVSDISEAKTEDDPPELQVMPNRDRIAFALIIILVLSVGGLVKRLIKPADTPQPSPSTAVQAEPPSVVTEQPKPAEPDTVDEAQVTPPETTAPAPQPEPATIASPPPPAEPKATPVSKPSTVVVEPKVDPTVGPPTLTVKVPPSARMGGFLPLSAQIDNLRPVDVQTYSVTAYYRSAGTAAYKRTELTRVRRTWTGKVAVTPEMDGGIDIFFRAKSSDSTGSLGNLLRGSNTSPIRVRVSSP